MRASATSSTDVLFADSVHGEKKGCFFGYFLCTSKESDPRYSIAEALALNNRQYRLRHHPHPHPSPASGRGEDPLLDFSFRWNGEPKNKKYNFARTQKNAICANEKKSPA